VADVILQALHAKEKGLTRADMIQELFRRNLNAERIKAALKMLSQHGLAYSQLEKTPGRPAERWFAVKAAMAA
jgi:hypothetical protein